jgi:hypothetical protein
MKTKDFDSFHRVPAQKRNFSRRAPDGMGVRSAVLGLACGIAVFAALTLLYHFG